MIGTAFPNCGFVERQKTPNGTELKSFKPFASILKPQTWLPRRLPTIATVFGNGNYLIPQTLHFYSSDKVELKGHHILVLDVL